MEMAHGFHMELSLGIIYYWLLFTRQVIEFRITRTRLNLVGMKCSKFLFSGVCFKSNTKRINKLYKILYELI